MTSTTDFLLNVIPNTVVDAFAKGEILQVLLFAVMFGFALHKFGGRGTLVFDFIEKFSHVLFVIVGYIMKVAPIGAFGAMAFTIGKYGVSSLLQLGQLMATFYATCLISFVVWVDWRSTASDLEVHQVPSRKSLIVRNLVERIGAAAHDGQARKRAGKKRWWACRRRLLVQLDGTSIY